MTSSEIQRAFLAALYRIRFVDYGGGMNWKEWAEEQGYLLDAVDRAYEDLREESLVEARSLGRNATITSAGALFVEEQGLVEQDIITPHQRFRTDFLLALAAVREEHGLNAAQDWETIIGQFGGTDEEFVANYQILLDGGYMESSSVRSFRLTAHGYDEVCALREKEGLRRQFDQLCRAPPQTLAERTAALGAVLEAKCAMDGWNVEHVELEPGAEAVPVFYRDLNFFLVDYQWPDSEIAGAAVRELRGRIASRPGTLGCVFSMAPISDAAISEAQTHLETACIIIFGPTDLAGLFHGGSMTEIVSTKMVSARIRRTVGAA